MSVISNMRDNSHISLLAHKKKSKQARASLLNEVQYHINEKFRIVSSVQSKFWTQVPECNASMMQLH